MIAVRVNQVSKSFFSYRSNFDRFLHGLTRGRLGRAHEHAVLRRVSFEAALGESVGLIGFNGAGKSTLLRIILGVLTPDHGTIERHPHASGLLELGLGFHPELTGRDNTRISLQLQGTAPSDIAALLREAEDFCELGEYFHQPLKTYSTGMQMRVAFAAATARRPQVLVIDEALAVGDAYFQYKSLSRIRRYREEGTTLFLVSHDPSAIKSLCDRALLLEKGVIVRDGRPADVLDYYQAIVARNRQELELRNSDVDGLVVTRHGDRSLEIEDATLEASDGEPRGVFRVGETARLRLRIARHSYQRSPNVGLLIRDRLGNDVFGTNTKLLKTLIPAASSQDFIEVKFTLKLNLGCGRYALTIAVGDAESPGRPYDWQDNAIIFDVIPGDNDAFVGMAMLPVTAEAVKVAI